MKIVTLLLASTLLTSPSYAGTQDDVTSQEQLVLKQLEVDQRSVYALNLGLTDEESKVFWPIYDQYEVAIKKVNDQRVALLNRYAERYRTFSGEDADEMLAAIWKCERAALQIHEKYAKAVRKRLPSVKALRYVQLQARIDNLLLGKFMSGMPLAVEASAQHPTD